MSSELTPRASRAALPLSPAGSADRTPRPAAPQIPDLAAATLLLDLIDEAHADEHRAQHVPATQGFVPAAAVHGPLVERGVPQAPARPARLPSLSATLDHFPLPPSRPTASNQGGTEAGPSGTSGRAALPWPGAQLQTPARPAGPSTLAPYGRAPSFAESDELGDEGAPWWQNVGVGGELLSSRFSDHTASTDSLATSLHSGSAAPSTTGTSFVFGGMLPPRFDGSDGQRRSGASDLSFLHSVGGYSRGSSRSGD